MKKRLLSIILCLCMVLMLLPVSAQADDGVGEITNIDELFYAIEKVVNRPYFESLDVFPSSDFWVYDAEEWAEFFPDGYYLLTITSVQIPSPSCFTAI